MIFLLELSEVFFKGLDGDLVTGDTVFQFGSIALAGFFVVAESGDLFSQLAGTEVVRLRLALVRSDSNLEAGDAAFQRATLFLDLP